MKFIKATKRIAAVAASGLIAASAVSAAGLGSYPSNFVQDGEFVGNVVIGTGTGAADSAAALSVIDDLKADLSEDSEQVRITYRESGDGTSVSAVDDRDALNYGENLVDVKADLDYETTSLLEDGDVDNHVYTQELFLENGEFSYRVFDEVDEEKAMAGLYYDAGEAFMDYTLEFDEVLDVSGDKDEALIGEELIIMGNEFTIVEIADADITLIGGANKVSLGEGESTKVTVDGNSYDISIQSVADDKVLLTVNGQTDSINIYETEELAGVSIAVTDLVSSSRDAVKGYSEIVIGGQKVQLSNSGVEINDEDVEDIYPDYEIDVEMIEEEAGNEFEGFTITYRVDQDTLLKEGDYLEDVLFDAFSLSFDGVNEPDYNEYKITTSSEDVKFSGFVTHDGNALPSEFMMITSDESVDAPLYFGDDDTRIFFSGSKFDDTSDADATANVVLDGAMEGVYVDQSASEVHLDLSVPSSDVDEVMFFQWIASDEYQLYDITSVNDNDVEVDVEELITGKSVWNGLDIEDLEDGDLDKDGVFINTTDVLANASITDFTNFTTIDISELGSEMLLENGLVMNFAAAEDAAFDNASGAKLAFSYDAAEIDPEDVADDDATFDIEMVRDTADIEDPIELTFAPGSTDDWFSTELEEDSDFDVYVDKYGTMVTIDTDDKDDVTIAVPEEEVEGSVSVVFGEAGSTNTVTVAADNVEAKKAELEADGYTIVSTEDVESVSADVDIDAPILDTDVTSVEDAIVVGGPAVNSAARELLGISAWDAANPVGEVTESGDYIIKYYEDSNSVLVYGWTAADTAAAAAKLNAGGLSGDEYTN